MWEGDAVTKKDGETVKFPAPEDEEVEEPEGEPFVPESEPQSEEEE
jgi:hypothetical protein